MQSHHRGATNREVCRHHHVRCPPPELAAFAVQLTGQRLPPRCGAVELRTREVRGCHSPIRHSAGLARRGPLRRRTTHSCGKRRTMRSFSRCVSRGTVTPGGAPVAVVRRRRRGYRNHRQHQRGHRNSRRGHPRVAHQLRAPSSHDILQLSGKAPTPVTPTRRWKADPRHCDLRVSRHIDRATCDRREQPERRGAMDPAGQMAAADAGRDAT